MQVKTLLRSLARIAVIVAGLGAVSLALAFRLGSESTWWIELARYAPYPAYLLPALLALGLSLWLSWRWRLAAALALVIVLIWVMDLRFGQADEGAGRLRLMTYNIKSYRALEETGQFSRIAWEVAQHDPDVLVMQDAEFVDADGKQRPEGLKAVLAQRQHFQSGQFIIASRYPLRDCRAGQVPYRGQQHSYLRCTLAAPGRDIDLVTAHFKSPRDGLNATRHERLRGLDEWRENFADRMSQAHKLASDLHDAKRPLIIAGDLNAPQHSPVVQRLLALGLRDAFGSAGLGWGYTHGHSLKPHISFLRIDHILVSDDLGLQDAYVGGPEGSEHRPVIADLLLQRQ